MTTDETIGTALGHYKKFEVRWLPDGPVNHLESPSPVPISHFLKGYEVARTEEIIGVAENGERHVLKRKTPTMAEMLPTMVRFESIIRAGFELLDGQLALMIQGTMEEGSFPIKLGFRLTDEQGSDLFGSYIRAKMSTYPEPETVNVSDLMEPDEMRIIDQRQDQLRMAALQAAAVSAPGCRCDTIIRRAEEFMGWLDD